MQPTCTLICLHYGFFLWESQRSIPILSQLDNKNKKKQMKHKLNLDTFSKIKNMPYITLLSSINYVQCASQLDVKFVSVFLHIKLD